jgi:hypothetical protein
MTSDVKTMPGEDLISILLGQHRRMRQLMADVRTVEGEHKRQAFNELRVLLATPETRRGDGAAPAHPVDRRERGGRAVEGRPFDPLLDRARDAVRKVSS